MTVETDITPNDFKAFGKHVATGRDRGKLMYTVLFGSGAAVGILLGLILAVTGIELQMASLMAGLFGGAFWLVLFSRLYTRKMGPAADSYALGRRTVSTTDDGVIEKSHKHEALFRWPSVRSVDLASAHIFIMIERNAAIIVPRRAFSSDAERDRFLAELRRHKTDALK